MGMPIIVSTYIRAGSSDKTFGVPAPLPQPSGSPDKVFLTQRGERFTGYHLAHDTSGNVIFTMPSQAWLHQPAAWSRRELTVGLFDLRAP
jgi:hypothetical protein